MELEHFSFAAGLVFAHQPVDVDNIVQTGKNRHSKRGVVKRMKINLIEAPGVRAEKNYDLRDLNDRIDLAWS
jgi:hypothetical protein